MSIFTLVLILLVSAALLIEQSYCRTLLVSSLTGTDAGDCSQVACKTLSFGLSQAAASGDQIQLSSGQIHAVDNIISLQNFEELSIVGATSQQREQRAVVAPGSLFPVDATLLFNASNPCLKLNFRNIIFQSNGVLHEHSILRFGSAASTCGDVSQLRVEDCTFSSVPSFAIDIQSVQESIFLRSDFLDSPQQQQQNSGIRFGLPLAPLANATISIESSRFSNLNAQQGAALQIYGSSGLDLNVVQSVFTGVTTWSNQLEGSVSIHMSEATAGTESLSIPKLTFRDNTFTNSGQQCHGGHLAFHMRGTSSIVAVERSLFQHNCGAEGHSAAISFVKEDLGKNLMTLDIKESRFEENAVVTQEGNPNAVVLFKIMGGGNAKFSIIDSSFIENQADGEGIYGSAVVLYSKPAQGGERATTAVELRIEGSTFSSNTPSPSVTHEVQGGAITIDTYDSNTRVFVKDSLFERNVAGSGGAAIAAHFLDDTGNILRISNTTFLSNSALSSDVARTGGGALLVTLAQKLGIEQPVAVIDRSRFEQNHAPSGPCGTIYVQAPDISSAVYINDNNNVFVNNRGALACPLPQVKCFGKFSNDSTQVCLGLGTCVDFDTCQCLDSRSKQPMCSPCNDGEVYDIAARSCSLCPAGTSVDVKQQLCVPCSPGSFSANTGSMTCELCRPGHATSKYGSTDCERCQPGSIAHQEGMSSCALCPAGKHASEIGSTDCLPCSPGSFAQENGTAICTPCPEGTASSVEGATSQDVCVTCEAGHFAPAGSVQCYSCLPGSQAPTKGRSLCTPCEPGSFSSDYASTSCEPCARGHFAKEAESTRCEPCAAGFFASRKGMAQCEACPKGQFQSSQGQSGCQYCSVGSYSEKEGQALCKLCKPGSYAGTEGTVICSLCAAGTAQPSAGSVQCLGCEKGTFAEGQGNAQCSQCPYNTFGRVENATTSSVCSACGALQSVNEDQNGCVFSPAKTMLAAAGTTFIMCCLCSFVAVVLISVLLVTRQQKATASIGFAKHKKLVDANESSRLIQMHDSPIDNKYEIYGSK